eukprot:gene5389-6062_t
MSKRNDIPSLEEYSQYDDPLVRREIRASYRSLIDIAHQNKDELIKPASKGLSNLLEETESLFDKVRHTREAVLDSNLLLSVASLGSEQAKQLQTDFVTFDPQVFTDKLVQLMVPKTLSSLHHEDEDEDDAMKRKLDSLNWNLLAKKCSGYFKRAPTVDFMLGPLIIEVKKKPAREGNNRRNEKFDLSQKVAPEEISKVEEQEEATTKEVERIYSVLRKVTKEGTQAIGLFEFITDPASFGATVENLFHLSFLVKDGKARIDLDENEQPTVCKSDPYHESHCKEIVVQKQIIMPLSIEDWKEIIEVYDIKEATVPKRPELNRKQR